MENILKRNNVTVAGKGEQPIIFVHGFGCDQTAWKYITSAFADDYKLILIDLVGAGKSDYSAYDKIKYSHLNGYASDVVEICEALKLKDVIFIGHSVSCMIGVLSSIKKPLLFKQLILIGPSPRYLNDVNYIGGYEKSDLDLLFELMDDNYINWSNQTAPAIMGVENSNELGNDLAASFCTLDPEIAKHFARVTFLSDNRKDLPLLSVDSLTLQCKQDILAPEEVGYYINSKTKNNTLVLLDATGHCPHQSAPQETIQAIKSYLSKSNEIDKHQYN